MNKNRKIILQMRCDLKQEKVFIYYKQKQVKLLFRESF
jgi:hypothetical protein